MSRTYASKPDPNVAKLIQDSTNISDFYLLQRLGPMAFIIQDGMTEKNKIKVCLGYNHYCSCQSGTCIHIIWVLIKIFHISVNNPILWQKSLVEREIEELLANPDPEPSKDAISNQENNIFTESSNELGKDLIEARPLTPGSTCPICLEGLEKGKITHCKTSCGNNIHVKCLLVLVKHQKSLEKTDLKCVLCRISMGTLVEMEKELSLILDNKGKSIEKAYVHYGLECHNCHDYPIKGSVYKCMNETCPSLYLCTQCFKNACHQEHAFETRNAPRQKWQLAKRAVPVTLPTNLIADFQSRELDDSDYQTLLLLDSGPEQQNSIPLHVISSFTVFKANNSKSTCKVCMVKIRHGQLKRRLPCKHSFHQSCVDRWLIHTRASCPVCGSLPYSTISDDLYGSVPEPKTHSRQKVKITQEVSPQLENFLVVSGSAGLQPKQIRELPPLQTRHRTLGLALAAETHHHYPSSDLQIGVGNALVKPNGSSSSIQRPRRRVVKKEDSEPLQFMITSLGLQTTP